MYVQICNTFSNSQIKTNSGINFPVNRRVPTRFAEIPANASRHFAIYFSSLTIAYLQSQVNVKYLPSSPLPLLFWKYKTHPVIIIRVQYQAFLKLALLQQHRSSAVIKCNKRDLREQYRLIEAIPQCQKAIISSFGRVLSMCLQG